MKEKFRRELLKSRYVHTPLPIHEEETMEARCENKIPVKSVLLDDLSTLDKWDSSTLYYSEWTFDGIQLVENQNLAHVELSDQYIKGECKHSVKLTAPTRLPGVPEKATWRGGIMCIPRAYFHVNHENWEEYNRISFWIYVDVPGFRNPVIRMQFHNEGTHPVPDKYDREGHHNVNLQNGVWRHVTVEIPYLHRDDVVGISFDYDMCGKEPMASDTVTWYISDLRLEKIAEEELDHYSGWDVGKKRIAFSGSGYQTGSLKTAVLSDTEAKVFSVLEAETGKTVLTKAVETIETSTGRFQILNFTEVAEPGSYYLSCNGVQTRTFPIGDDIWEDSIWKVLNFFFCERCGYYVPNKHQACCWDRFVGHNGKTIVANGGWHDAGDMSQNLTNTSETTTALFTLALQMKDNKELYERLVEEGLWGLQFMLKTRFGDGYRAWSVGGSYWTDGFIGDGDDRTREADNKPIENFMAAGAEALGFMVLRDRDPMFADYALKCAKEDWNFAYEARDTEGYTPGKGDPARASHQIVMYSTAVWSAIDIYNTDGDPYFKDMAIQLADEIIACQQQEIPDWDIPFTGFFYRDREKKMIVHYNHRSHENEPLIALGKLCTAFPDHPDWIKWYYAVVLYSEYYKKAVQYTSPYYMSPASIYHIDEARSDPELFVKQQAIAGQETIGMYDRQVREGVPLGKGYYLRRFPVWFAFRGNNAITLAGGKAAAQAGLIRNNYGLAELAQRQLEWIVGKNPFAQSVMFGEGYDYSQQYAVLPGEMVGELSVGIEALDDQDSPFWPQVSTATYKEVWMHVPLRWAWLCADTYGPAKVYGNISSEIVFTSKVTGKSYSFTPNTAGAFSGELPAGAYTVTHGTEHKTITLLPTKSYAVNGPLNDYSVEYQRDGNQVLVTLHTTGTGTAKIALRLKNIAFDFNEMEVSLGDTVSFKGTIEDEKYPYLAVIVPDGNLDDKLEIFGQ